MSILITGNTTLGKKLISEIPSSRSGEIEDLSDNDQLIIFTQGTSRGGVQRIIDRCYTEIVTNIESIERKDIRYIVIGSIASEYSSWPGMAQERMIYANAKKALSQFVSDYNQRHMNNESKSLGNHRIQICEPSGVNTVMNNYTGKLEISNVADCVKYLIDHPEVVRIPLRA